MPSIRDAVAQNSARIAAGGSTGVIVPAPAPTIAAAVPPVPLLPPVGTGLPVRGTFSPGQALDTDFQNLTQSMRSGPNMRSPAFPPQQQTIVQKIVSKVASVAASVAGLVIKVNNSLSPNQSVLNLLNGFGISITVDAAGNVVFTNTSQGVGDGITHGQGPGAGASLVNVWETDPAYFFIRDDFVGTPSLAATNTPPISCIGEYGWYIAGTIGTHGGILGGGPGYNIGQVAWDQTGTASNSGLLKLPNAQGKDEGGPSSHDGCFALFETPGWQLTWIFKVDSSWIPGSTATSTAQKSIYVGLVGPSTETILAAPISRPAIFFGLRYDTDPGVAFVVTQAVAGAGNYTLDGTFTGGGTNNFAGQTFVVAGFTNANNNGTFLCTASTAITLTLANASGGTNEVKTVTATTPVLNDAFWTFEATVNAEYPASQIVRNNTVGAQSVTSTAPVAGVWHRLDMVCIAAGSITMTLDGTTTWTTSVPTYTATATGAEAISGDITNNVYELDWSALNPLGLGPWGPGSSITVSGFTGGNVAMNGTFTVGRNNSGATQTDMYMNKTHANISTSSNVVSVVGYPIVQPACIFGNDSVASPPASSLLFYADYFSLVMNPNLGAGGTPTISKPRYW